MRFVLTGASSNAGVDGASYKVFRRTMKKDN
jgi:hypothetical protein